MASKKNLFSATHFLVRVTYVTTFKTTGEAIAEINGTLYGTGAGVWTIDANELYQAPATIQVMKEERMDVSLSWQTKNMLVLCNKVNLF